MPLTLQKSGTHSSLSSSLLQPPFKKFTPDHSLQGSVILIIGLRNQGKSTLTKDLLSYISDIPTGIIISPEEIYTKDYQNKVPDKLIYREYKPNLIPDLIKKQTQKIANIEHHHTNDEADADGIIDPRIFLVLDSVYLQYPNESKIEIEVFLQLINQARELLITLIITSMCEYVIPPSVRSKIDLIFIFKRTSKPFQQKLYQIYGKCFFSLDDFVDIIVNLDNYLAMVIKRPSHPLDPDEATTNRVLWYRADEHRARQLKICNVEDWTDNEF